MPLVIQFIFAIAAGIFIGTGLAAFFIGEYLVKDFEQ